MNELSRPDLAELIQHSGWPSVSIFLPITRGGSDARQGPIRLRNLIRKAEDMLISKGMRRPDAAELLQPATDYIPEAFANGRRHEDGLAIFISPGQFRHYWLSLPLEETWVVADRFHVRPVLPIFHEDGHFYVLALSLNARRLFQCTESQCRELELGDAPVSLADAMKYDVNEKQMQWQTRTPPSSTGVRRSALFHGSGNEGGQAAHKKSIEQYLLQVDRGVQRLLATDRYPLVVAAVEYLQALYREITGVANLLPEGLMGNPDRLGESELRRGAWALIQPTHQQARQTVLNRYGASLKVNMAIDRLELILPAAMAGTVDMLLVDTSRPQWGTFNRETFVMELHDKRQADDEDLVGLAVGYTLLHRGKVFPMLSSEMPDGSSVASVLRVAMPMAAMTA